ncbi:hypothetical protein [Nioella aestuarii]|uniref:hypothetical protein n=1 Tax=Nioella aestuarii TaxID=1662864 RepID=UPI003D7F2435
MTDHAKQETTDTLPLRPPSQVMRLARLGSFHQCRLSFMRQLTRRMAREGWRFARSTFEVNAQGVGHAVYTAAGPDRSYSLVAFAHDLPDELRSDRVIAEAWDATFTLFDGVPTQADIDRLAQNVPVQEAGRISESELSLSRANRSVRLWTHVVDRLSQGLQPDPQMIAEVGYLMRTTAVYGSGKFGAADREVIADRPEMATPFQAEMLSVYLTRWFVRDIVEHMAKAKGGDRATTLDPALASRLGIGNSTGLGMAPFLVNHPMLLNNWILVRETALARVRALPSATPEEIALFSDLLASSAEAVAHWRTEHPIQLAKLADLRSDLAQLLPRVAEGLDADHPWDGLCRWSENALSLEGQELLVSLMLEPYGALVDGLGPCMAAVEEAGFRIDGSMTLTALGALIEDQFPWALGTDWTSRAATARAWYVSEEKLEPRLGERHDEDIAPYEQPLAPGRDAAVLYSTLAEWPGETPLAVFLLKHPEHRHTARRLQIGAKAPYGEIRDNTIGADMLPIDMLRAKLSFFGANCFDPRSDRWIRITMFAGAPYPPDLTEENADFWVYQKVTA